MSSEGSPLETNEAPIEGVARDHIKNLNSSYAIAVTERLLSENDPEERMQVASRVGKMVKVSINSGEIPEKLDDDDLASVVAIDLLSKFESEQAISDIEKGETVKVVCEVHDERQDKQSGIMEGGTLRYLIYAKLSQQDGELVVSEIVNVVIVKGDSFKAATEFHVPQSLGLSEGETLSQTSHAVLTDIDNDQIRIKNEVFTSIQASSEHQAQEGQHLKLGDFSDLDKSDFASIDKEGNVLSKSGEIIDWREF